LKAQLGKTGGPVIVIGPNTKASELFQDKHDRKCTLTGSPGEQCVLPNDLHFADHMSIGQTQNTNARYGYSDTRELRNAPPHSAEGLPQNQVFLYRAPKAGFCDIAKAPNIILSVGGDGKKPTYTFGAG